MRSWSPRARYFIFCPVAQGHVGESLSGCGLHVRILPSSVQPAVILRQGERSDAGAACATASCESHKLPPTRICNLTVGMVDGRAEMVRVIPLACAGIP